MQEIQSVITITIKNSERRLTQKHILHDVFAADPRDAILAPLIAQARKEFKHADPMLEDSEIDTELKIVIQVV